MTAVFAVVDLFSIQQNIVVYKDDEEVFTTRVRIDDLPKAIIEACYNHDVYTIRLKGYGSMLRNVEEKIYKLNSSLYDDRRHEINIIEVE